MTRNVIVIFLCFFSLQLFAMEEENSPSSTTKNVKNVGTITVNEMSDFLFEVWKGREFRSCRRNRWECLSVQGKSIATSFGISAFASWPVGVRYCVEYCESIRQKCINDCYNIYPKNNTCWVLCPENNNWVNHDNCALGIGIMFIPPVFTMLGAYFGPKIMRKITQWADKRNDLLRANISEEFNFRDGNDFVTDDELRFYAPLLMKKKSSLIKKLTFHQALICAEENLSLFHELVTTHFSNHEALTELAEKLVMFADMNIEELEENLENERISLLFNNDKKVWETIVRIIPERNLTKTIRLKLLTILKKIINDFNTVVDKDNLIDQIRKNKKENIEHATPLPHEEGLIHIARKKGPMLSLSKNKLLEISGLFQEAYNACDSLIIAQPSTTNETTALLLSDEKKVLILNVSDAWLDVLEKTVHDEELIISINLKNIFHAAAYFKIETLLQRCDNYLAKSGTSHKALLASLMEKTNPSFKDKWAFVVGHKLILNEKKLAKELIENFGNTDEDDIVIVKKYINEFLNKKLFKEKLKNKETLRFAWKNLKDIPDLRNIIIKFCDKNRKDYAAAWFIPDPDLKEALDNFASSSTSSTSNSGD